MSEPIPAPTFTSTIWQAVKIFAVVVIFIACQQAIQAFTYNFDWSKLLVDGEVARVFKAIVMGFVFGAMQGVLRAVQILLAIWSGPSIWGYLGPVLAAAQAVVSGAASSIVNAFRRDASKKETSAKVV